MSATAPKEVWAELLSRAGFRSTHELSMEMGVAHDTVKSWIDGSHTPGRRSDVETLADMLYTDPETIFPGWESPQAVRHRQGNLNPLRVAMINAGFSTIKGFAAASGFSPNAIKDWSEGAVPRDDEAVYRVSGLLNVAPTALWPEWQPRRNPFSAMIHEAGYESISDFARAMDISVGLVDKWIHQGTIPRYDDVVLRAAELLHVEPNVLWPDWKPRSKRKQVDKSVFAAYAPRMDHGIESICERRNNDTCPGMAEIRKHAHVYVGQRMLVCHPTKEETVRMAGTVAQCADGWFRVRYDAGWSECFPYQARLDQTEHKYFRTIKQDGGGA